MKDDKFKKELKRRFKNAIEFSIDGSKDHFEKDGWDLNFALLKDHIIQDVIGISYEYDIIKEYSKFSNLVFSENIYTGVKGFVFRNKKYPVFYNTKTNELEVLEQYSNAKNLVNKHLEYIGGL